jgi:hypothetical protein
VICPGTAFAGAGLDKFSLEFRETTEHGKHQATVRGRGVRPGVGNGAESATGHRVQLRYPITGIPGCCARAASGHEAAALPRSVMNWRRFICSSQAEDCALPHRQSGCASQQIQVANVRFGSKADIEAARTDVRYSGKRRRCRTESRSTSGASLRGGCDLSPLS